MEKSIRDQFNERILAEAILAYGISRDQVCMLDGFESYIFEITMPEKELILRIGHDSRRSPDLVQAESEFLNHLSSGGLSVPRVLPSLNHHLVESITAQDGSHFLTTLFTKAPGHPPTQADWKPPLFNDMGRFMGKLHHLSKSFQPSQSRFSRYDFAADVRMMLATGRTHLPPEDAAILGAYEDTAEKIFKLPKSPDSYGLIHVDFHRGNFFITDQGQITLFDFDDCQYACFVYDIAMALFYAIPHDCDSPTDLAKAGNFLAEFWAGYQAENDLDPSWLQKIPLFLRLREIDLYMMIHRSFDIHNLDWWCTSFMTGRREKILNQTPYCDLDYAAIAAGV
jgi:Ser/Thr protein kinase RdoA (MazF antagonist)